MYSLIAIGTGVAFLYSIYNYVLFIYQTGYWIGLDGMKIPNIYFEVAGLLVMFVTLGKYLEAKAKGSTSQAIEKLMGLAPKGISLLDKGGDRGGFVSESSKDSTQMLSLDIEGMHCSSCALLIEKSLKKVSGVQNANVNFSSSQALVKVDPNISQAALLKAVENA